MSKDRDSAGYADGSYLRYYGAVNEAHQGYVVYELGDRGFFAEVTTVARGMIYGWSHGLQLALDSSNFSYRFRDGWTDYFRHFCKDLSEVEPARIRERFFFTLQGDRKRFEKLRGFDPPHLRFGTLEIDGMQPRMRHFMKLIFRFNDESQRYVDRLRKSLGLPGNYVAVHVRRGDKVGDEDKFYPVEQYFKELGQFGKQAIFVMSDDYRAVDEVREYVRSCGFANRVATLCRQEHTGFDIWKLRDGKSFAGGEHAFDGEEAYRRYAWEETNRLLAETVIAAGASRFVSTFRSNVGKTVWYLHDRPDDCRLLTHSPLDGQPPARKHA